MYKTDIRYMGKYKDPETGKKLKTLVEKIKRFDSRTRAKKWLKYANLKNFISLISDRPEPVVQEKK